MLVFLNLQERIYNGIVAGVEDVIRKFGFWLISKIYPLISTFYEMFGIFAKNQIISNISIKDITNNIYVVVAILMLFILSVKLISAIVNPNMLTDKKNGVTSVFKRLFIAIMLIALLPWAFSELYDLQSVILSKSLVQKILLGFDRSTVNEGGDVIYAYALETVLLPRYNVTTYTSELETDANDLVLTLTENNLLLNEEERKEAENAVESFDGGLNKTSYEMAACAVSYYAAVNNSNLLSNFSNCINTRFGSDADSPYLFEFNGIIAIILGFVLAYEMLLLALDMALRGLKLVFLQIISPIVICAYIYSGDILQKWAKEYISTFVLLFVKLAAVSVMIFGISLIPSFIASSSFSKHRLLIQIFIIIGLLQLIKHLPGIINAIFGTNVKYSGGIKGRLGEMAGVGKIAQDGWSKLLGKAGGAGKTLALLPLGAAGSGLKKGFNRLANSHTKAGIVADKIKKTTTQMKNGRTGRLVKTVAAGVNSNGQNTSKALKEAWKKSPITVSNLTAEKARINLQRNKYNNMNDAGTATVYKDKYGNPSLELNSPFQPANKIKSIKRNASETDAEFNKRLEDFIRQVDARNQAVIKAKEKYLMDKSEQLKSDLDNYQNNIKNHSSITKYAVEKIGEYNSLLQKLEKLKKAKEHQDDMISIFKDSMYVARDDAQKQKEITGMIRKISSDSFYKQSIEEQLKELAKFRDIIDDNSFIKLEEDAIKYMYETEGVNSKGASNLSTYIETITKSTNDAKKVVDSYTEKITDEKLKSEFDGYLSISNVKIKEQIDIDSELFYLNTDAGKKSLMQSYDEDV